MRPLRCIKASSLSFLPSPLRSLPHPPRTFHKLSEFIESSASTSNIFTLSPAPTSKDGVRVSGETKLPSQHLFHPLLLNWPERTKGEGVGHPLTPPPTTPRTVSTPTPDSAFQGWDRPRPRLDSLPTLRGWHLQMVKLRLSKINDLPKVI